MMKTKNPKSVILVVDDNPTNLNVLFDVLGGAGFETLFAEDGESAIERAKHASPDLILLDILMPELDGFSTCTRLKSIGKTKDIPIIFMTALSDTIEKVHGFDLGAVDYITKPFQHVEVLSRVKTHLTIKRLRQSVEEKNEELQEINKNLEKLVENKTKLLIKQEKSAIIGRLLQGMVHNLKNPLNAVIGYNNLIFQMSKELAIKKIETHSQTVSDAAHRMIQIMDNLMVKSRLDESYNLADININDMINQELKILEANTYFRYSVDKVIRLDPKIKSQPLIYSSLSQVFHNIVNNALDAMWNGKEKKSVVSIITRQEKSFTYIDIVDNGCGINPDQMEKIFDPFFTTKPQDGEAMEGEPTGTGLGLHTCSELLKPFDGKIEVNSNLGEGSKFTIVLPKSHFPRKKSEN